MRGANGTLTDSTDDIVPGPRELTAMLQTVRTAMSADSASILLLDRSRTVLEPAAVVGLDRTLRGARRVPMGAGFAGRVAQTRQPVVLTEVTSATVLNPVLLNNGVKTLLGVPILAGSELLGVLHVGTKRQHDFTDDDVLRLTEFAAELGTIVRRLSVDQEHAAALTLQRSLLPTTVPAPAGISIAARYVPADGNLGGDWYDAFVLPSGVLGVVMGDVVGHGLDAAVIMGRLRSTLRAYALEHSDPADVLARLDRKISHFEPDVFATVLFGVADAPYERWLFSAAGHLPPIVGGPGMTPMQAKVPVDRLLGLGADVTRRSAGVVVPEGGFLCLFTDGLVERRPGPGDFDTDFVEDNLKKLIGALTSDDDPEMSCIRILAEVVGDYTAEDDIALLVARRDSVQAVSSI